ncbi:MAG: hypothetical protein ABIA78_00470 [archaeon]
MEEILGEFIILFPGLFFLGIVIYCFYRYFVLGEIYSLFVGVLFSLLVMVDVVWYLLKRELFFKFH